MAELLERLTRALEGRYEIERELGRGGMATVYLAQDSRHERQVAVKVLKPELAAVIGPERFLREIKVTASFTHPHILPLHDSGEADSLLYYVMPYAEGESLRDRLNREKQLSLVDALRIAREIADALDYAHRHHVLHRDIKPENILLEEDHAVVADFGIARAVEGGEGLTATGVAIGTPAYMSPEQASGEGQLDARSDLYSLGCVLYEMLAGKPPFTGPTAESVLNQHRAAEVPAITAVRPGVPSEIEGNLSRLLAKTPADRYPTAGKLAEALQVPLDVPLPGDRAPLPRRWFLGAGLGTAIAALGIVAVITGVIPVPGCGQERTISTQADPLEWIWVADFDGPANDALLSDAARNLVAGGLDQSGVVAAVPRQQVKMALRLAQRPDTVRVDAELAKELAYRSAIRAVVTGQVDRIGSAYSTILRVEDVERDSVLFTVSEVADGEDKLISVLTELTEDLNRELRRRRGQVSPTRPGLVVDTPSLEAYRKLVEGERSVADGDWVGAIEFYRDATRLDPGCAVAYHKIGIQFRNLQMSDSARVAIGKAHEHRDRLSDERALLLEADREQDVDLKISTMKRILKTNPNNEEIWNDLGVHLGFVGQIDESVEALRRAIEIQPVGGEPSTWSNLILSLIGAGRFDEAREVIEEELPGAMGAVVASILAAAEGEWSTQDSLTSSVWKDATAPSLWRYIAATGLASARAARGEISAAAESFDQGRRLANEANISSHECSFGLAFLRLTSQLKLGSADAVHLPETMARNVVANGLNAAANGNLSVARESLGELKGRPRDLRSEGVESFLPVLEAWIATREDRWETVVELARPVATAHRNPAGSIIAKPAARWLVANAYESMGRADSAAYYYELALSPLRVRPRGIMLRGLSYSFIHQRLVLLYASMGRLEDARRHWEILSEIFTRPDPEVKYLVDEAREALTSAEAMAAAEKG
jgi:serine/threonine-protein kinase